MSFVGLLGKVPTEADFVRHNIGSPAAQSLDQWVREAHTTLTRSRGELPSAPVRFLFSDGRSEHALVGTLRASRDQVGRAYPVLAFAAVPAQVAGFSFPALHGAFDAFLSELARVLDEAEATPISSLLQRLESMAIPEIGAIEGARMAFEQASSRMLVEDFHERLFGGAGGGQQLYAYSTFLTACTAVRGGFPSKPGTMLDCPYASSLDVFVWLELARRALRWPTAPSAFWSEGAGRLLLSLGPAPSRLLELLSEPDSSSQALWPLRTERQAAVEAARRSLGPALQRFGPHSEASVAELLETLEAQAT